MALSVSDEFAHPHRVSDAEREAIRRNNAEIVTIGGRPEAEVAEWIHWHPYDGAHLSVLWNEHEENL